MALYEPVVTENNAASDRDVAPSLISSDITLNEHGNAAYASPDNNNLLEGHDLQLSHECSQIIMIHELASNMARNMLSRKNPDSSWSWSTAAPEVPGITNSKISMNAQSAQDILTRHRDASERNDSRLPMVSNSPIRHTGTTRSEDLATEYSTSESIAPFSDNEGEGHKIDYRENPAMTRKPSISVERAVGGDQDIAAQRQDHEEHESGQPLPNANWQRGHRQHEREPDGVDVGNTFGADPAPSRGRGRSQYSSSSGTNPSLPAMQNAAEQSLLARLEALISKDTSKRNPSAEEVKFDRLERLLIEQQQAKIEKDAAKRRAEGEAAAKALNLKKKGDEDKLAKLEKLILAQKDEQLKREMALNAARLADKAEADAKTAKVSCQEVI
jgi:hypothetical protein